MTNSPPIDPASQSGAEHLWAPWRMSYVSGEAKSNECLFCEKHASSQDIENLVIWRSERLVLMLNLYPYNTGHLMIASVLHVASPEEAPDDVNLEIGSFIAPTLRFLRRALGCQGFNTGLNTGAVAGAGVADHMHWHIVPRWQGDANFMPVVAGTTVMPELLTVTYAKLRTEAALEFNGATVAYQAILNTRRDHVCVVEVDGIPKLPAFGALPNDSVTNRTQALLPGLGIEAEPSIWAGSERADEDQRVAIAWSADEHSDADAGHWLPVDSVSAVLSEPEIASVDAALLRMD